MIDGWQHYVSFRPELCKAFDPRCYSIEWLDGQVFSGRFQLWACPEAVLVTEVKMYPTGARDLHGMIAAGSLEGISRMRERSEDWARGEGVEFASAASRPGWARVLERHGYALHQVELRKELQWA